MLSPFYEFKHQRTSCRTNPTRQLLYTLTVYLNVKFPLSVQLELLN